jgi:hypothetical protein
MSERSFDLRHGRQEGVMGKKNTRTGPPAARGDYVSVKIKRSHYELARAIVGLLDGVTLMDWLGDLIVREAAQTGRHTLAQRLEKLLESARASSSADSHRK